MSHNKTRWNLADSKQGVLPITPARKRPAFNQIKSIFLLMLLLVSACNLPTTAPPTASTTPFPLSSPTLVSLIGFQTTSTPFQPSSPTPVTLTPTPTQTPLPASPTPTPVPYTATPTIPAWPPPHFGAAGPTPVTPVPPPVQVLSNSETINFLLLGSDRRGRSYRTDAIIIASIRPRDHLVTLISIPRDLFVYIPGWTMQRINTAYQHGEITAYPGGGQQLVKDTILYNLGIQINHVALVEFSGFKQIIDTLGGIDVPLVCSFTDWHIIDPERSESSPSNWSLYTIGPGVVQMDGDLALWYSRSRLRSSDFDRGRRQQEILRAIYSKGMNINVIPRIPALYNDLRSIVSTDINLHTIMQLVPLAANLNSAQIRSYYINRTYVNAWRTPQGAAVQLPDYPPLFEMLQEAMGPPGEVEDSRLEAVIEIWNGTPNRHWDILAAERLHYLGYNTKINPPDDNNYTKSLLIDLSPEQDEQELQNLGMLLGLPTSALMADPDPESDFDYRFIIGQDYNTCFNPATLP
jgi:polyisoprenyl-teichoic acid--peptidoglycan teichoic acid transferase